MARREFCASHHLMHFFSVIFMYFEKSTVDVATVVKLWLCIVCPSTFHPVRLLNSTLSPFSQNGQAVRMQTMQRCRAHFPGSTGWSLFLPSSYEALRCYYFLCEEWETTVFFPPLPFFLYYTAHSAGTLCYYETWPIFSLSLSFDAII